MILRVFSIFIMKVTQVPTQLQDSQAAMVQTFQVLRCYKCSVFQVHPTKKSIKFQCKLCGEKQSIKRHYGLGTAKDCRLHVQKLNGIRGDLDEQNIHSSSDEQEQELEEHKAKTNFIKPEKSKWNEYIEPPEEKKEDDNLMFLDDKEIVLEIPKKRTKRSRNIKKTYPKTCGNACNDDNDDVYEEPNAKTFKELQSNMQSSHLSVTKFKPPLLTHSKSNINNSRLLDQESKQIAENKPKKLFKPPVTNSSKWAQFVDEDENFNQDTIVKKEYSPQTDQRSHEGRLFSLCEDTELDDVLNF